MPKPSLRVATDVGGTFTDLVAFETDANGRAAHHAPPSPTPRRPISKRGC